MGRRTDRRVHLSLITVEEPQIDQLIVWPTEEGVEVYIEPEGKTELCVVIDWLQVRVLMAFLEASIRAGRL